MRWLISTAVVISVIIAVAYGTNTDTCDGDTCSSSDASKDDTIIISPKCAAVALVAGGALGAALIPPVIGKVLYQLGLSSSTSNDSYADFWDTTLPDAAAGPMLSSLKSILKKGTPSAVVIASSIAGGYLGMQHFRQFCSSIDSYPEDSAFGKILSAVEHVVEEYMKVQKSVLDELRGVDGADISKILLSIGSKIMGLTVVLGNLFSKIFALLDESGRATINKASFESFNVNGTAIFEDILRFAKDSIGPSDLLDNISKMDIASLLKQNSVATNMLQMGVDAIFQTMNSTGLFDVNGIKQKAETFLKKIGLEGILKI